MLRPDIKQLLPPHWPEGAPPTQEDVEVPAGRFQQAIIETYKLRDSKPVDVAQWTHPDVPFRWHGSSSHEQWARLLPARVWRQWCTELFRNTMTDTNSVGRGLVVGAGVGWLGFQ